MGAERLGRYTVLRHLASGGMADVLLARTDGIEGFERHVVLKRIRPEHARDQRFIQMFLDEARVAANLHHANIVQVNDIGENRGEYFFAMEYLHGEDLRKILSVVSKNKTHMPLAHVVAIVSAAAAGLHYAHERKGSDKRPLNIVHRDVSPSNIIVGYDGSVKVVDFGIAKAAMRQLETRSGSLKGKVSYMSPEQCKGDPIDRRSDVYALGVLLYELSTTSRLFKGENDYLMMDAIVNGKIPLPRVRRPDLPNELSSIIMRCLSVDPMRRYQSADELRIALDQFAANAGMTTSQSTIATYMRKLFGEKPEPWLDGQSNKFELQAPPSDEEDAARNSWNDLAQEEAASPPADPDKTRSDRKSASVAKVGSRSGGVAAIPPRETRTSMNMGWEQTPGTQMPDGAPADKKPRGKWIALAAVPLLAAVGFGVWQLGLADRGTSPPPTTTAAVAPAPPPPPPTISPIDPPAPPPTVPMPVAVAPPSEPAVAVAPPPVAPAAPAVSRTRSSSKKSTAKVAAVVPDAAPAPVAAPPPPTPAPVVTPPPAPPPPPQVAQAAPPPPPNPTPAAPPVVADPVIAQLSQATVQMVASDHSAQLGKCDSVASDMHGEVSVAFQIDATGKVVKSQLSSSVKNPKLAACILRAVTGWKFPKPPTGAAKGTYSISYQ